MKRHQSSSPELCEASTSTYFKKNGASGKVLTVPDSSPLNSPESNLQRKTTKKDKGKQRASVPNDRISGTQEIRDLHQLERRIAMDRSSEIGLEAQKKQKKKTAMELLKAKRNQRRDTSGNDTYQSGTPSSDESTYMPRSRSAASTTPSKVPSTAQRNLSLSQIFSSSPPPPIASLETSPRRHDVSAFEHKASMAYDELSSNNGDFEVHNDAEEEREDEEDEEGFGDEDFADLKSTQAAAGKAKEEASFCVIDISSSEDDTDGSQHQSDSPRKAVASSSHVQAQTSSLAPRQLSDTRRSNILAALDMNTTKSSSTASRTVVDKRKLPPVPYIRISEMSSETANGYLNQFSHPMGSRKAQSPEKEDAEWEYIAGTEAEKYAKRVSDTINFVQIRSYPDNTLTDKR